MHDDPNPRMLDETAILNAAKGNQALQAVDAQNNHDKASPNRPRTWPPLSPTEKKVYSLLLQRITEQQVADQLQRSHNTVHVHVRNIYRKLGIRSRQELYEIAPDLNIDIDA